MDFNALKGNLNGGFKGDLSGSKNDTGMCDIKGEGCKIDEDSGSIATIVPGDIKNIKEEMRNSPCTNKDSGGLKEADSNFRRWKSARPRVGRRDENGQVDKVPLQRRLSVGDVPYSYRKKVLHSPEEKFVLGRADAIPPETFLDVSRSECHHRICITEVVPSTSSIIGGDRSNGEKDWRLSISEFTEKKYGKGKSKLSKRMRSFYEAQDELINTYEDLHFDVDDAMDNAEEVRKLRNTSDRYAKVTLGINVCLLLAKLVAAILSGSISIISSLVDSCVDLASGLLITLSGRAMKNRDPYVYPQGRTKLEPISIVILSVIMSLASIQLIRESVEKIVGLVNRDSSLPNFDIATIVITASTIVIKLILFILCKRIKSPSVQALAQDHRNDVLSNSVALIFGYIGSQDMVNRTGVYELCYLDPVGAILISIYIAINWWITGYDQIKLLTGHTAKPDFLKKLTWLCVNHHPKLQYVDTVRAFHFGTNFLVEVDIVLPEDMSLKEAHDIGEPLQQKLERLPEVERAFVHLDYEFEHRPADEHKQV